MSFIAFRGTIELLQSAPVLIMARPAHGSFKAGPLLRLQQMDQIVQIEVKSTIRYRRDAIRECYAMQTKRLVSLSIPPLFWVLNPHSQSGTAQRIRKRWSMTTIRPVPQVAKECGQLIEIVANFPKELVIALRYTCVSDLISRVECEF
jgi:hypothetical protein